MKWDELTLNTQQGGLKFVEPQQTKHLSLAEMALEVLLRREGHLEKIHSRNVWFTQSLDN